MPWTLSAIAEALLILAPCRSTCVWQNSMWSKEHHRVIFVICNISESCFGDYYLKISNSSIMPWKKKLLSPHLGHQWMKSLLITNSHTLRWHMQCMMPSSQTIAMNKTTTILIARWLITQKMWNRKCIIAWNQCIVYSSLHIFIASVHEKTRVVLKRKETCAHSKIQKTCAYFRTTRKDSLINRRSIPYKR